MQALIAQAQDNLTPVANPEYNYRVVIMNSNILSKDYLTNNYNPSDLVEVADFKDYDTMKTFTKERAYKFAEVMTFLIDMDGTLSFYDTYTRSKTSIAATV